MSRIAPIVCIAVLLFVTPREANALITGGVGNTPVRDPGWPEGAAAVFNHPGRIAWWEGPPFGGGQSHAECRGDAVALSAVLKDFTRIDARIRRVILHDGTGYSVWLAPNSEPETRRAAKIDWSFTVWQPASWRQLRALPVDLNPTRTEDTTPPVQIDVYTGGLDWTKVTVPAGLEILNQRLSAHGFRAEDGAVLEGKATDLSTGLPLTATIELHRVEPQPKGGYLDPVLAKSKADDSGRWVLKNLPSAWVRLVVQADGFVPRVAGYVRLDGEPRWQRLDCGLSRAATVSGRVTDEAGKALADVNVRLDNVQPTTGGRYETTNGYAYKTDADGRFRADAVPLGKATVWAYTPGYFLPGLGQAITTPKTDVLLVMRRSAGVLVTVDFAGKARPAGYLVRMSPETGDAIGTYGGSGNIDAANRMAFENVPPGRYVLTGRPNPGSDNEETESVTVDLKGGETSEITLKAK